MRRWWLLFALAGCGDGASPPDGPPSARLMITQDGVRVTTVTFALPLVNQVNYTTVSVANVGAIPSKSVTVTLTGSDTFAVDDRSTCAQASLDVNSSCTIVIAFTPIDLGEQVGTLRIASGEEVVKLGVVAEPAIP